MVTNKKVTFRIDEKKYELETPLIMGSKLKELAGIEPTERLVIEINGKPDIDIINDQEYSIENGMKLYSSKHIKKIKVEIDGKKYELTKSLMTGKELKQIANIPIEGYKLLKEVKDGQDIIIEDDIVYDIDNNDIIFAMPTGINNGGYYNATITCG